MTTLHVKKGDIVKILAGDDKGKTGKIVKVFPEINKVLVEGINMMKRHEKSRKQGQKGQIVEKAMPVHASNVVNTEKKVKGDKKTVVKAVTKVTKKEAAPKTVKAEKKPKAEKTVKAKSEKK